MRFGRVWELESVASPQAEKAADELKQILEEVERMVALNARRMKRVMKLNVFPLSPRESDGVVAKVGERVFEYRWQRSEPFMRRRAVVMREDVEVLRRIYANHPKGRICTLVKINRDIPAMLYQLEGEVRIVLADRTIAIPEGELKCVLHRMRFYTHFCVELFTKRRKSFFLDLG